MRPVYGSNASTHFHNGDLLCIGYFGSLRPFPPVQNGAQSLEFPDIIRHNLTACSRSHSGVVQWGSTVRSTPHGAPQVN